MDRKFLEATEYLTKPIRTLLHPFPEQEQVREICLRSEKPLMLSTFAGDYFVGKDGGFLKAPSYFGTWQSVVQAQATAQDIQAQECDPPTQIRKNSQNPQTAQAASSTHTAQPSYALETNEGRNFQPYIVSRDELRECVRILTEYSLHSYQREINAGFITIRGGHRAGIAGSCVYEAGRILSVNEISSVSLRIARQITGVADGLVRRLFPERVCSTLIAGEPASGKTTLLKDIARCLSGGVPGYYTKLSLIDERGEIAAVYRGVPQNDVGIMTDVFDGYQKGEGMAIAIRAMSPRALILDEIAGEADAMSVRQGLNAGVAVIATVHASNLDELYRKRHIRALITEGAFEKIVLLRGADAPCQVNEIVEPKELTRC